MLITQTPLRVSLVGGGTDLSAYYSANGGAVLTATIDKYIYVILNSRFDDKIYISYSEKEIVDSVDEIKHELVREAMRKAGVTKGIELAIMADIPSEGCGLGSSSSLTVGLLNAFYAYRGIQVPPERLAEEACDIEINICGKPIGKQDQYIAAYGGLRFIEFNSDDTVTVNDVTASTPKSGLDGALTLFYTNITRQADVILANQNERTADNVSSLDTLKDFATTASSAVASGDYDEVGRIMGESWLIKKELAKGISTPQIEKMVDSAMSGGATGCKVCGAGGGGFLLTYSPLSNGDGLRKAMSEYREMPFFFDRSGSKVIFNVESYEW